MSGKAVLFVCLGNICRSPTAEAVFRHLLAEHGVADFDVDSAGTGDWHVGRPPHGPAQRAAMELGYDMSKLRARQVVADDFRRFDYILAMDQQNLADLRRIPPEPFAGHLGTLTDFASDKRLIEIDDPYGGSEEDFRRAVREIEAVTRDFFFQVVNPG